MRIWRQVYQGGHAYIVTALNNLGYLSWQLDELEKAEAYYSEAITLGVTLDAESATVQARDNLAMVKHHRGLYEESLALRKLNRPYETSKLDPDSSKMIWLRNSDACLYMHLRRLEEAENQLSIAMEIVEMNAAAGMDRPGSRHYQQHLLGQLRAFQGHWPQAERLLSEALQELRKKPWGSGVKRHAYRMAEALCRQAGRMELADAHAEALAKLEASLRPGHRAEQEKLAGASGQD